MPDKNKEGKIIWYKDSKYLIGTTLIIVSFIMGFFGKGLSIIKFYNPVYVITGISIWAFSFIVLFLGVFLVGWETVAMIKYKIKDNARKTYNYTKELPKRGYNFTKKKLSRNHKNGKI